MRPERENWSGCPSWIYWCLVARVISGTLILFGRKEKEEKRAHCRCSSSSSCGVFGLIQTVQSKTGLRDSARIRLLL